MMTPSAAYHRLAFRSPPPVLFGLDARIDSLIGIHRRRSSQLERLRLQAQAIDAQAAQWKNRSDAELHGQLMEFRRHFRRGGAQADQLVTSALAAIREAAERKLGLRPFEVQLMGALALNQGSLAEMATGEGKTLTAGVAAVLAGWTRHPCHVVTVNDYLVERDTDWMRPLYSFCGVRVGCVTAASGPVERLKGYEADVTYVTSKELLADFLRDRLQLGQMATPSRRLINELARPQHKPAGDHLVMRGLHTAIVDEADSLLIDEAVTPLIISATHKNPMLEGAVKTATQVVAHLDSRTDYHVDLRYREVRLTPEGQTHLVDLCNDLQGLWQGIDRREELIRQALVAREFFLRDKQYIIVDGKIVIVDEFTGRQMAQRTWRQGLHQAIEAKESLPLSDPTETVARLSFQRFFRCFYRLAGMTGTAREAATEFWRIYRLPVVTIPTNKPCKRADWPERIFANQTAKWEAVAAEVERLHITGRPILVGTRSVQASEMLGTLLAERNLPFRILNATRHQDEAVIVAMAGERGQITIATNMAGRGTDIKLGKGVAELGGLHIMATERHESRRVDRQLLGRAGRQGDAGSGQVFVSVEDEIIQRYLPRPLQAALRRIVRSRPAGWPKMASAAFALAQYKAQQLSYRQRQTVLRSDTWLEESLSFARHAAV
jgi:preprotein translocase subunit SecA